MINGDWRNGDFAAAMGPRQQELIRNLTSFIRLIAKAPCCRVHSDAAYFENCEKTPACEDKEGDDCEVCERNPCASCRARILLVATGLGSA